MFGEGERQKSGVAVLLGTGRNLRPVQGLGLGPGEAEQEVLGVVALSGRLDLVVAGELVAAVALGVVKRGVGGGQQVL